MLGFWKGYGNIKSRHPLNGCLKREKCLLIDEGNDLCTQTAGFGCFMNDDSPSRLSNGANDGF